MSNIEFSFLEWRRGLCRRGCRLKLWDGGRSGFLEVVIFYIGWSRFYRIFDLFRLFCGVFFDRRGLFFL